MSVAVYIVIVSGLTPTPLLLKSTVGGRFHVMCLAAGLLAAGSVLERWWEAWDRRWVGVDRHHRRHAFVGRLDERRLATRPAADAGLAGRVVVRRDLPPGPGGCREGQSWWRPSWRWPSRYRSLAARCTVAGSGRLSASRAARCCSESSGTIMWTYPRLSDRRSASKRPSAQCP